MIGRACGNGRDGGGQGGSEDRYHFPAVDAAKWDTAKVGRYDTSPQQGEAGQVIGAYVNTMEGGRGKIMGATINCCWPENGFM
jgi:hypothetical protein